MGMEPVIFLSYFRLYKIWLKSSSSQIESIHFPSEIQILLGLFDLFMLYDWSIMSWSGISRVKVLQEKATALIQGSQNT